MTGVNLFVKCCLKWENFLNFIQNSISSCNFFNSMKFIAIVFVEYKTNYTLLFKLYFIKTYYCLLKNLDRGFRNDNIIKNFKVDNSLFNI